MEYYPSNVPKGKDVDGSVRTQCVITIRGGSSRNRLLLLCDSYREGIALLEQAMIQLDSIEIGRLTWLIGWRKDNMKFTQRLEIRLSKEQMKGIIKISKEEWITIGETIRKSVIFYLNNRDKIK